MKENGRIRLVLVKHHGCTLDRLQCIAVLNDTSQQHRIDCRTGRKYIGESGKHIALIVVCNCICQVKGICSVAVEIALERDNDRFALDLVQRRLFKRRGEENALCILHNNIFIESKFNLSFLNRHVNRTGKWFDFGYDRRNGILRPAARGLCGIGT